MMLAGLLVLLFFSSVSAVDEVSSEQNCSYQDVLEHLNLTRSNELYSMTRPVRNYRRPTHVSLEVLLYAILDVVEKDQKFIPYVWTATRWHNEYISWDPNQFCGIDNVSLPTEILWKPDLTIEEMTEKDKAPPSPYLSINNEGYVEVQNDQVLVSTCRMHVYLFPFDIQSCSLSFKSVIHTEVHKWTQAACIYEAPAEETSSELLSAAIEVNSNKLTEEHQTLGRLSDVLRELEKTLNLLLDSKKDDQEEPGYWTRVAKRVNGVFLIFYVTVVSLFLVFIFVKWNSADDHCCIKRK